MHLLRSCPARAELRPYVRAYAQREVEAVAGVIQPVPASLEHVIEFDFIELPKIVTSNGRNQTAYRTSVVGPHTSPGAHVHLIGKVESFGIFFEPCGLWQLFRVPNVELADEAWNGADLFGAEINQLWMALAECACFEERVARVDAYLLSRAARASGLTPIMGAAVHLFGSLGRGNLHELSGQCRLSVRHFERRFKQELGMTPKLFARITRFQMALDAKLSSPQRTWLRIAHQFGYHDQMHMIRDFKDLSGDSPERFIAGLGDTRPPALCAAQRGELKKLSFGE